MHLTTICCLVAVLALCLLGCAVAPGRGDDRAAGRHPVSADDLLGLDGHLDPGRLSCRSASAALVRTAQGPVLEVTVPGPDSGWSWPGVAADILAPPGGLAAYGRLSCTVRNVGSTGCDLGVKISAVGPDGDADRRSYTQKRPLAPGETAVIVLEPPASLPPGRERLPLWHMAGVPPWAQGDERPAAELGACNLVTVFATRPAGPVRFQILGLQAQGGPAVASMPDKPLPFVDRYGQYMHADWPGKIHADGDLAACAAAERTRLSADPGPAGRDPWGGAIDGPRLPGTGRFATAMIDGRWWLIDPDGRRFFAHALHGVRFGNNTPVDGRDDWFAERTWEDPAFADCTGTGTTMVSKRYAPGTPVRMFSPMSANLRRKHGPAWKAVALDQALARLPAWGFTAIGANSDPAICLARRMPFFLNISGPDKARRIAASTGYWCRFYDPFDADFAPAVARTVAASPQRAQGLLTDPWCIGVCIDNELPWGAPRELAIATLRSPADQPAKAAFIARLTERYGTIAALNQRWGTAHATWEALSSCTTAPDAVRAGDDLDGFQIALATAYFQACRAAVAASAPGTLYLGCRFMHRTPWVEGVAADHCDVVSFNNYQKSAAELRLPDGHDRPILITEFHITAPDAGHFSPTGLVEVPDAHAQVAAYRAYLESALANRQVVGCTWFMYADVPITGSQANGETYAFGFIDITDTPRSGLCAAARLVGDRLYAR